MTTRRFNFSAGPAVLPESVLMQAREDLLSLGDTGIGILEHSHRGKAFLKVYEEAVALCREVGEIPDDYDVLFLQGGASSQFFMIPMNFLTPTTTADYWVTGAWSEKAVEEAQRFGQVHIACTGKETNYSRIPTTANYSDHPAYVHYTSNNTIFGTQFHHVPEIPTGPFLVCDASSDIYSRPIDVKKYGLIYAGAQKNLGPSGVTLVIIRKDLVERAPKNLPTMLQYRTHAANESMYNTPPTFGIYIMGLVFKWIKEQGGLPTIAANNEKKAGVLYDYLKTSKLFRATADEANRSLMNVTFVTGNEELDKRFLAQADKAHLDGLKGHRSVGGMRASIYNAFPIAGVEKLVDVMREFEAEAT
ncbi:MAG: 3-phosphoserine/phosphohydroxythreonine transaminase [Planctomycetaceae bacterium]